MLKHGEPATFEHGEKCPGEIFEVDSAGGSIERKGREARHLHAGKDKMLSALEKAEVDLQKSDDMPADRKAEILTKVRAKIAELRARG